MEGEALVQVKDDGEFTVFCNASSSDVCCHYWGPKLRGAGGLHMCSCLDSAWQAPRTSASRMQRNSQRKRQTDRVIVVASLLEQ